MAFSTSPYRQDGSRKSAEELRAQIAENEQYLSGNRQMTETDRRTVQYEQAIMNQRQPQRRMSESLAQEPGYSEREEPFLSGKLHPRNWKALANRRVPWPSDVDPNQALFELAPFLTHRMLEAEASARGTRVTDIVGPHEDI